MIDCIRLVALEVMDDFKLHCKHVTAIRPNDYSLDSSSVDNVITIRLCGQWYGVEVNTGDTFHVILLGKLDLELGQSTTFEWNGQSMIEINDEQGLFVIHPDSLLSPTRIAESCACIRRGVISERIRLFGEHSSAAALGNVKHSFIEALISNTASSFRLDGRSNETLDISAIGNNSGFNRNMTGVMPLLEDNLASTKSDDIIKQVLAKHAEELYAVGVKDGDVKRELSLCIGPLKNWLYAFSSSGINLSKDEQDHVLQKSLILKSVNSIEDTIWSPVLGIKGQLDATVTCMESFMSEGFLSDSFNLLVEMPLEIKTGKRRPMTSLAHRAQVRSFSTWILRLLM